MEKEKVKINPTLVSREHLELAKRVKAKLMEILKDDRFDIEEFPQDVPEEPICFAVVNMDPELRKEVEKNYSFYMDKIRDWEYELWRKEKIDVVIGFSGII